MMKRIIALLLALILTVGLLPTVALAAEGTAGPIASVTGNDSSGNVHVKKEIYQNDDGTYKVRLESWATGTQTIVEKHLPMDIVLVLDVSGSMKTKDVVSSADTPTQVGENEKNESLRSKATANNLFVQVDGNYYPVTVQRNPNRQGPNTEYTYSYTKDGSTVNLGTYKGSNRTYSNSTMPLYSVQSNNYITRLEALKNAVNAFIDNVAKDAKDNKVDHKISIVKFAGDEENRIGNNTYTENNNTYNYTQIVKKLTPANVDANVTALKEAVTALNYGGATQADFGMNRAAAALDSFTSEDVKTRGRIVIMFTDGVPTDYQDYDNGVAGNAVAKARELKDKGAKVYTIAMIGSANPSDTSGAINRYMNGVSSNYPKATKCDNGYNVGHWYHYGVDLGTRGDGSYYQAASSSADSLKKIFDAISKDISNNTTALDESAILFDELPENFEIPANAQNITTKTADYTGENTWGADTTVTNLRIKPKNNNTLFEITGFNYADNWCGKRTDNSYGGKKLIVEFNIQHDNYGGTQPTNKSAGISNEEEEDALVIVPNPSIAVPIAIPSITGASATKVYDGTGIDVLANVAAEADKLVTGENEGKNAFVDIIVKVKDANNVEYTYTIPAGATTGSWSPENPEFKTLADVKIVSGAVSNYTYGMTITFEDATDNGAPKAIENATATYTITKRPVTLTSGSDEKKYDGTPLTKHEVTASTGEGVGFVGGDEAAYTFTGSQTEPGESDNKFEYTLIGETKATNYEITKQLGKLKVTQDDTEITVTITGKQETKEYNGQTQEVVGFTYTVEGAEHDDVTVTLKTGKEAKASGKDVLVGTDGTYDATRTYPMNLTADDFNVSSTKYSNVTIKEVNDGWLKITPIAITLKSGDASKTYDGTALTNTTVNETGAFVTGEGLNYTVTGSQTEVGTSENTYTYTAKAGTTLTNYTITEEKGTLTVTLPDPSIPTVTVDCINPDVSHSDKTDITLTAATQYELGDPREVTNESAYTRTITLTDAGKEYCIGEYNKGIAGHTEAAGGTTTITLKYSKEGSEWAWRATRANFLVNVQCNTPTVNVNLGNYIKKTLTGTNFHENFEATFTVEVTYTDDNDSGTATGSVRFTGADTKDFGFASTVELKKNHVYKFTATERADNVPGVVYNTRTYSFALKITAEGDVVFGSVVEGVFVADETDNKYVTITNTYTKPTYAVGKFVIESAASDDFPIRGVNADDYQYPTNGKYIVEKTYTSDTITFLYVIKVSGNQGAVVKIQETDGGEFAIKDSTDSRANIVWNEAEQSYTVTLNQAVDASNPIKLYAKKTFTKVEGKFPTTATNALLVNGEDGPKDNTTIEERGTLTVDFGALVHKHLTVTGDKSFNGATFTVNFTEGLYAPLAVNNSIEVYADAGVGKEKLPDLTASVTYTADERDRGLKDFDGADLTINTEGNYSYIVSEQIPAGATGYDTKKYVVGIVVVPDGDGLKVEHVWYHELVEDLATHPEIIPGGPTFYNTIDTGKDDYYPIIIPTIINKDTGMLNKTDHFAYVIGYPDGTVHPNGQITRAEVATIFFRLLRDEVRDGAFTTSNSYSDVAYGKWYNNPISTMSALGIITGYPDGTFKPNKPITRAEFAAIAARFDETQSGKSATFSDVIGHWAAKEIGIAYYNDWIKGYPDGTFKPDQNITRAEAMTLINRVLERKPESPADLLTNMNKWTDNMDTSKWYYLDVQEATNSHGYTRKTFNYELWRQMLPDPDWSRYER